MTQLSQEPNFVPTAPPALWASMRAQMSFFAQEKKRLVKYAQEPAARDYLVQAALCPSFCFKPMARACPSESCHALWTGMAIAPNTDIAHVIVEAWGVPTESYYDLADALRPAYKRAFLSVVTHDIAARGWVPTYTVPIKTPSLKDCLWIYPAKIKGTRTDGDSFTFYPAIEYAKGLHALQRADKMPELPAAPIVILRPYPPTIK